MVKLSRIYTRGGDRGETSLGDGRRVAKHDLRVAAYGTVDEANAALGWARAELARERRAVGDEKGPDDRLKTVDSWLARIQNDLFDLGADLCVPEDGRRRDDALRITVDQVVWLEERIDRINAGLEELRSFVLPGGTPLAAALHLARTVVRRAERLVVELAEREAVNPEAVRYLNRLSDLLFVMARDANDGGRGDVPWVPGGAR